MTENGKGTFKTRKHFFYFNMYKNYISHIKDISMLIALKNQLKTCQVYHLEQYETWRGTKASLGFTYLVRRWKQHHVEEGPNTLSDDSSPELKGPK